MLKTNGNQRIFNILKNINFQNFENQQNHKNDSMRFVPFIGLTAMTKIIDFRYTCHHF